MTEKSNGIFSEGIYLSSPEFWMELIKHEHLTEKKRQSYLKYWIRSCFRCTPFATFAGVGVLSVGDKTEIIINDSETHSRNVRIDMAYLHKIADLISEKAKFQIKFLANNSLYKVGNTFRYIEYTTQLNTRKYQVNSVPQTRYIDSVINKAKNGTTLNELSTLLQTLEGVSETDAFGFLNQMIEAQLLVSSLQPTITGDDPFKILLSKINSLHGINNEQKTLNEIFDSLNTKFQGIKSYQNVEEKIKLLLGLGDAAKNLLQVDLGLSAKSLIIDRKIIENIATQVWDLRFLNTPIINADLETFVKKFKLKFEDAEVPLPLALDLDLGVGYANDKEARGESDLIDDLRITSSTLQTSQLTQLQKFSLKKYHDYLTLNQSEIDLTDDNLSLVCNIDDTKISSSLYILGNLLKAGNDLTSNNFKFNLQYTTGPSALNLLGRFISHDKKLRDLANELVVEDEINNPDVIYAEIVHLPETRLGNILCRPVLRDYEITFLGNSGIEEEKQIKINDITVSIVENEVYLKYKKNNKRIIPRLSSAHNYSNNVLPIYKFLCDLQSQTKQQISVWDWGLLADRSFLPRVVYKNLILKKARWKIKKTDIQNILLEQKNSINLFKEYLSKNNFPKEITLREFDNELVLDLNNSEHLQILLKHAKNNEEIDVEELLFHDQNLIVADENKNLFTNELIIPIYNDSTNNLSRLRDIDNNNNVKRKFLPHSKWIYYKIYAGNKVIEKILTTILPSFINNGLAANTFEKFFFVRYFDDFPHLRIRFYNEDTARQITLQSKFNDVIAEFVSNGLIDKILMDTYSRELERYGAANIENVESLFFYDSISAINFLNYSQYLNDERSFVCFSMLSIDYLLGDFGYSIISKHTLLKKMQVSFFNEFGGSLDLQKQLNKKYRNYQKTIPILLEKNNNPVFHEILKYRSDQNKLAISKLLKNKNLDTDNLLHSLLHMLMNRLFITQQRKYELVVYHFLEKYYTSLIVRSKNN
ncbi:MAG: lantibiotic dehydratase [Bacteroidetes bacterium]|nr:lantibiotic dehydratase [Bacteroidota bacterium]